MLIIQTQMDFISSIPTRAESNRNVTKYQTNKKMERGHAHAHLIIKVSESGSTIEFLCTFSSYRF